MTSKAPAVFLRYLPQPMRQSAENRRQKDRISVRKWLPRLEGTQIQRFGQRECDRSLFMFDRNATIGL
ncbi:MAG: hypothetical protein JO279_18290 [Verrucomicrobia bacterium]|nr:hypothetical protein [Verrucomicrobiota bacterium]